MSGAGTASGAPESIAAQVDAWVDETLARHPVVGFAVGAVRAGSPWHVRSRGVADTATGEPITETTVFRIASITKTFTAIALMQLWENGLVDLDAPAGEYLRSYRLVPAEPQWRPATLRHLLTHTAGLSELSRPSGILRRDFGESVPAGSPIPSPADLYAGSLELQADPGTRFVYTNHGPTTVGQIVEDVTGEPLYRYFRDHLFGPLGMEDTDLLRSERVAERLATGYEIRSGGVKRVSERDMVTAGAASVFSTPRDMARYADALLGGGTNAHGSILRPDTLSMMFDAHYRPDPRIPGMGLGFFRSRAGGLIAVGHQGSHPGFHSHLMLDPGSGAAVMAFTNGARQADFWLPAAVSRLLGRLLGPADGEHRAEVVHRPGSWRSVCGWYRLDAGLADVRLRGMIGAGAEVFVRGGRLMFRFLTPVPALAAGFELIADDEHDPDVLSIHLPSDDMDPMRVVVGRDAAGAATCLHLDVMPITLHRRPPHTNPRRWAAGIAGALAAAAIGGRRATRGIRLRSD